MSLLILFNGGGTPPAPQEVTPGTGALIATGFAPTVVASDHKNVTPGVGVL